MNYDPQKSDNDIVAPFVRGVITGLLVLILLSLWMIDGTLKAILAK